jgi:hypothetical protein
MVHLDKPPRAVRKHSEAREPSPLVVVSHQAHVQFSPRGIRTRELVDALEGDWRVELIAGAPAPGGGLRTDRSIARKAGQYIHSSLLLDKLELWSARRFRSWQPHAAGAVLIGFPFSPLVYAARRLASAGIPYIVDVGDPWMLTAAVPSGRYLGRQRARRAEHELWANAAAGVVTTNGQALALQALYPDLPILVRPNGFSPVDATAGSRRSRPGSPLKLAHFGDLSLARADFDGFLTALARHSKLGPVEFHQFGSDWTGALTDQRAVQAVFHEPQPWPRVVELAGEYDAAVVIGNRDPKQLPSKAIAYLQLPIPRLAVVRDVANDSLIDYTRDKRGWTVVRADGLGAAAEVDSHLSRQWTHEDLAPPAGESWPSVREAIADFVRHTLAQAVAPSAHADR